MFSFFPGLQEVEKCFIDLKAKLESQGHDVQVEKENWVDPTKPSIDYGSDFPTITIICWEWLPKKQIYKHNSDWFYASISADSGSWIVMHSCLGNTLWEDYKVISMELNGKPFKSIELSEKISKEIEKEDSNKMSLSEAIESIENDTDERGLCDRCGKIDILKDGDCGSCRIGRI